MKRILFTISTLTILSSAIGAQTQDSIVERNVTIEREFKPTIQDAGKIQTNPEVHIPTITSQSVHYTDFAKPIQTEASFVNLEAASIQLVRPKNERGFARIGAGAWNSLGNFSYNIIEQTNSKLGIALNHTGQFWLKNITDTDLGINYNHTFKQTHLYMGADVNHNYFNYYGQAYDTTTDTYSKTMFDSVENAHLLNVNTRIGIKSLPNKEVNYKIQTGYELFCGAQHTMEHQVNTEGYLDWNTNKHTVGLDVAMQNLFYKQSIPAQDIPTHATVYIEPFYAWANKNIKMHLGVNLDFSSKEEKVFKPSPNAHLEWNIIDLVTLYGGISGEYKAHSLQSAFAENRYINPMLLFSKTLSHYKPLDATLGFKFRPQTNLFVNIFGGYELLMNQYYYVFTDNATFDILEDKTTRIKCGIEANYHYKDLVFTQAHFTYNHWETKTLDHAYDLPSWEGALSARVKVANKLYLQAETFFMGKRHALANINGVSCNKELKPTIDINMGATYELSRKLSAFAMLNNIINNKQSIYYGYENLGFNFLLGITFGF